MRFFTHEQGPASSEIAQDLAVILINVGHFSSNTRLAFMTVSEECRQKHQSKDLRVEPKGHPRLPHAFSHGVPFLGEE